MRSSVPESDAILVARIQSGDERAFNHLIQRYHPSLQSYLSRSLGSTDAADDLLQEIFVRLWHSRASLDPAKSIRSYLYASARRAAINAAQSDSARRRREEVFATEAQFTKLDDTIETQLERENHLDILGKVVDTLPEKRREVFLLIREHGLSYPEAAEVLGVTTGTVKTQMARAIAALASKLVPLISAALIIR